TIEERQKAHRRAWIGSDIAAARRKRQLDLDRQITIGVNPLEETTGKNVHDASLTDVVLLVGNMTRGNAGGRFDPLFDFHVSCAEAPALAEALADAAHNQMLRHVAIKARFCDTSEAAEESYNRLFPAGSTDGYSRRDY